MSATETNADQPVSSLSFPECVPTLEGDSVRLRAHDYADIERIVEQSRDAAAQRYVPLPNPYTENDAREFLAGFVEKGWVNGNRFEFAIDEVVDGVALFAGNVGVWPRSDGRFEVGFILHPQARGRGIMTRAVRTILDWVFTEKDAQVVLWCADASNEHSRAVARRIGFSEQVVLPNWLFVAGEYQDCAEATLTRARWEELR